MTYPTSIDLDDDSYPTDEWIEAFATVRDYEGAADWMINTFPEFVERIGYGNTRIRKARDIIGGEVLRIEYSTGGWSGQESFINAVERTPAWMLFGQSWRRGGHYVFEIPKSAAVAAGKWLDFKYSFHDRGAVARICGLPRQPPSEYDDAERDEWLRGYDA
jgi:hypothetical protein